MREAFRIEFFILFCPWNVLSFYCISLSNQFNYCYFSFTMMTSGQQQQTKVWHFHCLLKKTTLKSFTRAMHKFYWNNTHRSSSNGVSSASASSSYSNGSCSSSMAGGPAAAASGSGVKIADNQVLQSCSDFPRVNTMQHHHPQVPMRANGGTATIRVEQTTVGN